MPTTVTKTIGTGGDYTTLQAWEDASPANLVTSDQIWRGECFNQEFFSSSAQLLSVSGTTTDATRYKELTTYAGASFVDNASVQTNALRYNASNGAGIRSTYAWSAPVAVNESYFRISKMQISATTAVAFNGGATTGLVMDKCIVENSATVNEPLKTYGVCTVKNSLMVQRSTSTCAVLSNGTNAYNCTFVRTGSSTSNIFTGSYGTSTLQNCAFFGGATTLASGSSTRTYTTCYTDTASPPSGCTTVAYDTSTGSGFQNITDATRDFRIKTGSALIDSGTIETTHAANDIAGTARPSGLAYDVGCWELVVSSTIRPSSDVTTTGWTGVSDNTNKFANIDETTASDTDYITSPSISGGEYTIFGLSGSLAAGSWDIRYRANFVGSSADVRITLLDGSNVSQGASGWQTVTSTFADYTATVATTGAATRVKIEVQ